MTLTLTLTLALQLAQPKWHWHWHCSWHWYWHCIWHWTCQTSHWRILIQIDKGGPNICIWIPKFAQVGSQVLAWRQKRGWNLCNILLPSDVTIREESIWTSWNLGNRICLWALGMTNASNVNRPETSLLLLGPLHKTCTVQTQLDPHHIHGPLL